VEFLALGPLAAVGPTGDVLSLGPPRRRALLAALLVHAGTVLSVDRLIDLLWGAHPPPTAATMVHGAVAGLRRVIEPLRDAQGPTLLLTRDGGYVLEVRPKHVDAVRFERLLAAGRPLVAAAPERASQTLADALALWRGPALAGIEAPFARDAATRLEELRLECVEERIEAELTLGRHHDVVANLKALVAQYPLRERLCAQLMVGMYRSGQQADALAAYRALRRTLRAELGLEPGPELRRLERAVLQQSDDLKRGGSVRVTAPRRGGVLPVPISTFVGRVRERDDVAALLARHRLVTLTGPGGSGKTRLALEVARAMVGRTVAEAWLVDLAPVTTPAMVQERVADTLGIRAEPGRDLADTLAAAVSVRDVTILFDNCEQLVDACAELAQRLLTSTERLRLLATSRERLGVPGEAVYSVPPLATASPHDDWEQIAASDAVRLFADRAAAACPRFAVTADNAHLVLEVCRRLDGLPLALELAAARAATMPLRHLADRLDDRFRLLDSATRVATPRHRSLTATVAWSYDLLDGPQRTVFERVAVFPAAFALDAAEEVISGEGLPARDVGMLLSRLVTVSAVQLDHGPDGEMRYRLLETTRQFARQRLDKVTLVGLQERHARRYLAQAKLAEPHLFRAGSARWLSRLHSAQDNFRAALGWSFGPDGDPELGAQLVRCLWHSWDLRGTRGEGLHWVHAGLGAIGADRPAHRLPLLSAGALFHLGRADFDAVVALATEQLALARASGAQEWAGDALAMAASVAWARGDFAQAHRLYEDAVAASLAGGDLWRASMEQAQLARLHRDRQQFATARAVALRALAHAREVGEDLACGLALDVLASLEQPRDDVPAARRLVQEALAHYRRVGYVEGEASALHLTGRLALAAHEPDRAREAFERSLHLCRRIGHRAGTATALEGLAGLAAMVDDDEGAVLLIGAATALRHEIGVPVSAEVAAELLRRSKRPAARD
jgi:predicted ATPase/DNA-binding SARP family transcriptional activator